jgi:hypothetical protein
VSDHASKVVDPTEARCARLKETSACGRPSIERAKCRPATRPESGRSERRELHLRPEFHKHFCTRQLRRSLVPVVAPISSSLVRTCFLTGAQINCMDTVLARRCDRAALRRRPPGAGNALRPGSRAAPAHGGAAPGLAASGRARPVERCSGFVRRRRPRAKQAIVVCSLAVRVGSTPARVAARQRPLGDHRLNRGTQLS